jgi:uncharacterized protein YyaL (SSP411 family)
MSNHLAAETSPYLKQHADNPVDWYPWGEEALSKARGEGKPILLSIGYSACHWCHVMAHESFEDPATAALMNRWFVNIKVDREERPDLDRIYQTAQQLITGRSGGWPLTMFLSPEDQRPFFGGTYFPKEHRHGLPAFAEILTRVAEYYRERPDEVSELTTRLAAALIELAPPSALGRVELDAIPLERAQRLLRSSFDARFGGFGAAPKFPHAAQIERCLREWLRSERGAADGSALAMARRTLRGMADGGLFDHLGGGFARYSVDDSWTIPHFEKMLYDNGQLLALYATAARATGDALFGRTAQETAAWLMRDMQAPEGGFYSSLDADSEGHEGRFYVWQPEEVRALLSPAEYAAFAPRYGLEGPANFEGAWHLRVRLDDAHADADGEQADSEDADDEDARLPALLEAARARLLAARNLRVWPARDEKILTSWNALAIKGLAIAARTLERPDLADAATRAANFLHRTLWRDGRLLASYKDGRAHLKAYLDDYAFLADALLELLQTRWRSRDLEWARALVECMLEQFEDRSAGGFFFTAADHESLIHRSKSFADESVPAGNGIAASVLCRLGYLLGEPRYLDAAERTLQAGWPLMLEHPQAHMSLANALEDFLVSSEIVIIRGEAAQAAAWARSIAEAYAPARLVFAIPADAQDLPPALAAKQADPATPVAYVCAGMTCGAPLTDREALERALRGPRAGER